MSEMGLNSACSTCAAAAAVSAFQGWPVRAASVWVARTGVAATPPTPMRAPHTEAALTGKPWNADTAAAVAQVLQAEFSPISDMRASAAYRRQALGALLQRTWLESTGVAHTNLEHTGLAALTGTTA